MTWPGAIVEIEPADLRHVDLRDEAASLRARGLVVLAARAPVTAPDGHLEAPGLWPELLFVPSASRAGVAAGSDAAWLDAASLEEAAARYFRQEL